MGIYISSKGEEVETSSMNSFRLVNGLVKCVRALNESDADMNGVESAKQYANVEALKEEIISRLAPPIETPE